MNYLDILRGGLLGVTSDTLGAPVDLLTMGLRPLGYKVENPVMGSEWLAGKLGGAPNTGAGQAARIAGGLLSPDPMDAVKMVGLLGMAKPKTLYRGIAEGLKESGETGLGTFSLGKGLYSSPSKKYASGYGKVEKIPLDVGMPNKPLELYVRPGSSAPDAMREFLMKETGAKDFRELNKLVPDPAEYIKKLGYDGVIAGDEIVKY